MGLKISPKWMAAAAFLALTGLGVRKAEFDQVGYTNDTSLWIFGLAAICAYAGVVLPWFRKRRRGGGGGAAAAVLAAAFALECAGGDLEAGRVRQGGGGRESNWHFGPFFEYRRVKPDGGEFTAARPFWSSVREGGGKKTAVDDVLWPVFTRHAGGGDAWWSFCALWGGDSRETGGEKSWGLDLRPVFFCGEERSGEAYWGIFPLYGRHPHVLMMENWRFALWPLWHAYEVDGVRSNAVLWPFFTWREEPREGFGVWPLWGTARRRESRHGYALWPLVAWAEYEEDRDTSGAGHSWWVLPLFGSVERARESQTMVLPPFFSHAKTDAAERWRMPWPFVEVEKSKVRERVSVWPFWEGVDGYPYAGNGNREEKTWRVGWKLLEKTELKSAKSLERRFSFFPFVTLECRWHGEGVHEEGRGPDETFFRFWPFYSSRNVRGLTRIRALELSPVRHSEGLDRNWSPFWTLWEREDMPDGTTRRSVLFNFISWR